MFRRIYLEEKIKNHFRAKKILSKFKNVSVLEIENYGEVFFRKGQNYELQKKFPSLILAERGGKKIQKMPDFCPAPNPKKYYFSHILGCTANCKYCYLRGNLPSANVIVFVNYEDFFEELPSGNIFVSTAFENDSLALEEKIEFFEVAKKYAKKFPEKTIELRTKFAKENLLVKNPPSNLILSFTISDQKTWQKHEEKTSSPEERLLCAKKAQKLGWKVALHFDPLFEKSLPEKILKEFENLSYSTGGKFRMPQEFMKKARKKFPEIDLFGVLEKN